MQKDQQVVLVVEDEEHDRLLMQALLSAEGVTTLMAEDGAAALALVAERLPDLAIVDLMLPGGMDGFELSRRLKSDPRTSHIPIMIVTALQDRESRLKALEMGAEEFICKPVDRIELVARVRNLLKINEYQQLLADNSRLLEQQVQQRTAQLQESEQQFRGLVEQSIAGIFILQDGKFAYVNPRLAEIFGYASAAELVGKDALSMVTEKDRARTAERIRRLSDGEALDSIFSCTGRRPDRDRRQRQRGQLPGPRRADRHIAGHLREKTRRGSDPELYSPT